MRYPIIYLLSIFLLVIGACRTKKLNLKDEFTILSTSIVEQGSKCLLSGYVFNSADNSTVKGARINLTMPPFEKLITTAVEENGYFEIPLNKGRYNIDVVVGAENLFHKEGLKIASGKKVEVLIYLKNQSK